MAGTDTSSTGTGRLDPRRDPAAVAQAINARWRRYRIRAHLFGLVVGLIGTIPVVILTTVGMLASAFLGRGVDPNVPWDEVIWTIAFLVIFAASGAWAAARW